MKYNAIKSVTQQADLVERLTAVTEQLEDIVTITRGKDIKEPELSLGKLFAQMEKKIGGQVPLALFVIFRMFALKNLLRGRMYITAYTVGRQLGLSLKINSVPDFKKEISRFEIGEMRIKRLDEKAVNIQIDGTITSMGIKDSSHPICYFERGLLSGAVEKLLKRKADLAETTCCSQGDSCCTFKAAFAGEKKLSVSSATMETDFYSKENVKLLTTLASHSITAIENTFLFEKAKKQSVIDGLTRIYNHGYFQQMLKVEASRSQRHNTPLALAMIDIDNFKAYNDHYGHPHGDSVLKSIASLLVDNIREVDIASRYGGDEFALILPQTDMEGAKIVINRIRKELGGLAFKGSAKRPLVHLTFSIGVAVAEGKKIAKAAQLLKKADNCLLSAKRRGKNKAVFEE